MSSTRDIGIFAVRERLRQSMWFVPTLCVVLATGLAVGLISIDGNLRNPEDTPFVFSGGVDGARELVSTVAGSMVAFIGTVFSITILVLQLASSQFSPRALRTFLRDRRSQLPLGIFLATLVYALVVLWTIRSSSSSASEFVPHLGITGAYAMVLLSLGTFVYYIHHVSQAVRVANVVERIGDETRQTLAKRYPEPFDPERTVVAGPELRGSGEIVASSTHGVVLAVDQDRLVKHVRELGGWLEVVPYVGEFVATGSPLGRWNGDPAALRRLNLERHVSLGRERTMDQDLAFGIRQLVDIAEKALSPSLNDPTTATQALDQIHDVLRQLAHRTFPHEVTRDAQGTVRLVTRERNWTDIVHLAFDEISQYGESVQVQARLRVMLDDLMSSVPEERRDAIAAQLDKLDGTQPRPR